MPRILSRHSPSPFELITLSPSHLRNLHSATISTNDTLQRTSSLSLKRSGYRISFPGGFSVFESVGLQRRKLRSQETNVHSTTATQFCSVYKQRRKEEQRWPKSWFHGDLSALGAVVLAAGDLRQRQRSRSTR